VLDDVKAWRVFEQPAGKDPAPCEIGIGVGSLANGDLHKGACLRPRLPRRCSLAGGEADHDVTDAAHLARPHLQILRDVVALVEQADRGDTLRHGCAGRFAFGNGGGGRRRGGQLLRHLSALRLRRGRVARASGKQQGSPRSRRKQACGADHQASGVQAS
jgi:hypothetical protein